MAESILGSIVTLAITGISVLSGFLWYKFDKREARRLKKISKYAEHIKAYYLLEQTYIKRIKQYEAERPEQTIMNECRKKMKEDNQIEIGTLLSANDVVQDIVR